MTPVDTKRLAGRRYADTGRFFLLLVAVAVVLIVISLLSSPAASAESASAVHASATSARAGEALTTGDPWRFLVVNRWTPLSFDAHGNLGIGSGFGTKALSTLRDMLLSLVVFAARLAVGSVGLAAGGGLMWTVGQTADKTFASVARALLGSEGVVSGRSLSIVAIAVVLLVAVGLWRSIQAGPREGTRTFVIGVFALFAFVAVSQAAQHNVDGVASVSPTTGGATASQGTPATFSPSWLLLKGNGVASWAGNTLQQGLASAAQVMDSDDVAARDECERYVDALHSAAITGSADNGLLAGDIMVALDNLYIDTLWDPVRSATTGGPSPSSDASWCRFSEMEAGTPAVEQAELARSVGLYSDIVGFDPSLALPGVPGARVDGTAMKADGTVSDPTLLSAIFGPSFESGSDSSRATYFWAACQWDTPGGPVATNPAWADVKASAAATEGFWERAESNQGWGPLMPMASAMDWLSDQLSGDDHPGTLGEAGTCAQVVKTGLAGSKSSPSNGGRALQYGESYFLVETLSPWNVSALPFFDQPRARGDYEAYEFYRATQGLAPNETAGNSIMSAIASLILAWVALPTIAGLLSAHMVGAIAWVLLPFVLFALIVPVPATRRLGAMTLRVLLYSTFASVVFLLVIQFVMLSYGLTSSLLIDNSDASSGWQGFLRVIAAIAAFAIVKIVSKTLFVSDITTVRGAIKASTQIAARPILSSRGLAQDNMGFKRQNWFGRTASTAAGTAVAHGQRALSRAILNKVQAQPTAPLPSESKTPLPSESKTPVAPVDKTNAATDSASGAGKTATPWKVGDVSQVAPGIGPSGLPGTPQVKGAYRVDPMLQSFEIPKDGTVVAGAEAPLSSVFRGRSLNAAQYKALTPTDRAAYTFDPVAGLFVPKIGGTVGEGPGLSRNVNAPLSALLSDVAPEGVDQSDWDKTAALRHSISKEGWLGAGSLNRVSMLAESAEKARSAAAASGSPLADSPSPEALAMQAPGVASTSSADRAVILQRHPDGSPRTLLQGSLDGGRLVRTELDAAGHMLRQDFERDKQKVTRTFGPDGQKTSERWMDGQGRLSRLDGPAVTEFAPGGAVVETFALGGHELSQGAHAAVVRGAYRAVTQSSSEGVTADAARSAVGALSASMPNVDTAALEAAVAASIASVAAVKSRAAEFQPSLAALGGLPQDELVALATRAAAAVIDEPETYARATNSDVAAVMAGATKAIETGMSVAAAESLVRMVHQVGTVASADQLRVALADSVSSLPRGVDLDFSGLARARQYAVAAIAAEVAQAQSAALAHSAGVDHGRLESQIEAILRGTADVASMEDVVRAVRDHAEGQQADRLRATTDALGLGGPLRSFEMGLDDALLAVESTASAAPTERVTAIRDRFRRELEAVRKEASEQTERLEQELADMVFGAVPATMSEADFTQYVADAHRAAAAKKAAQDERTAAQMGHALDAVQRELEAASVSSEELTPLIEARDRMLREFRKVQGIRGWFRH